MHLHDRSYRGTGGHSKLKTNEWRHAPALDIIMQQTPQGMPSCKYS